MRANTCARAHTHTPTPFTHIEQMIKYNTILKERHQSIDGSSRLRAQNEELKMLLNQYLGSRVNQELYVPPTATISRLAQ